MRTCAHTHRHMRAHTQTLTGTMSSPMTAAASSTRLPIAATPAPAALTPPRTTATLFPPVPTLPAVRLQIHACENMQISVCTHAFNASIGLCAWYTHRLCMCADCTGNANPGQRHISAGGILAFYLGSSDCRQSGHTNTKQRSQKTGIPRSIHTSACAGWVLPPATLWLRQCRESPR